MKKFTFFLVLFLIPGVVISQFTDYAAMKGKITDVQVNPILAIKDTLLAKLKGTFPDPCWRIDYIDVDRRGKIIQIIVWGTKEVGIPCPEKPTPFEVNAITYEELKPGRYVLRIDDGTGVFIERPIIVKRLDAEVICIFTAINFEDLTDASWHIFEDGLVFKYLLTGEMRELVVSNMEGLKELEEKIKEEEEDLWKQPDTIKSESPEIGEPTFVLEIFKDDTLKRITFFESSDAPKFLKKIKKDIIEIVKNLKEKEK